MIDTFDSICSASEAPALVSKYKLAQRTSRPDMITIKFVYVPILCIIMCLLYIRIYKYIYIYMYTIQTHQTILIPFHWLMNIHKTLINLLLVNLQFIIYEIYYVGESWEPNHMFRIFHVEMGSIFILFMYEIYWLIVI